MILKRKFYTDTKEKSTKKGSGIGGGTIAALGLGAGAAYGIKSHDNLVNKERTELYKGINKIYDDAAAKSHRIYKKANRQLRKASINMPYSDWKRTRDLKLENVKLAADAEVQHLKHTFEKNAGKRLMKSIKGGALVATPIVTLGIGKHYYDKYKNKKNDNIAE